MKPLLTYAALLCSLLARSQQPAYTPFQRNAATVKRLLDAVEERYRQDVQALSGAYKKQTTAVYRERADLVKGRITQAELLTDTVAVDYITAVTHRILTANPSLNGSGLRVYFSRELLPNAASLGEGTIVFHIGLFSRLRSEAQMAFVLCHELGHYFLAHGNNAIHRYVETVNGEEFQERLKQIKQSEFERNRQLEKLALSLGFKNRRYSREFEQAADSMALSLLKGTGYDVTEITSCLALLDSVDKPEPGSAFSVEKGFDFPAYPFRKRWLGGGTLMFTDTEEEVAAKEKTADSLKTHPDCSKRISSLEGAVNAAYKSGSKKFIVSETVFRNLQQAFEWEALEYCLESGRISLGLFLALRRLHNNPQNAYLLGVAARCFNKLYTAQKEHTLGKITDLPNPDYDETYNALLKMLQNVRLTELAAIQYHFLQTHQEAGKANEDFVYALIQSKGPFEKPEEKEEWIRYYRSQFPKPKYKL